MLKAPSINWCRTCFVRGLHLIDQIFIEVHTEVSSCCAPPFDRLRGRHWQDAMRLLRLIALCGGLRSSLGGDQRTKLKS
eukprot:394157-Prymnesium_polylepis.4